MEKRYNYEESSITIYRFLYVLCLFLISAGLFFNTPGEILQGFVTIVLSPSNLLTDYFAIANVGATLFNAGLTTLITVLLLRKSKTIITGPILAASLTICGFAFFGKNVYNSIPFMIGTYLYSKLSDQPFSSVILVGLFSTSLSPLISEITFAFDLPFAISTPLAYSAGILIGIIMNPLGAAFLRFHQGYNLYNIGFTAGIVGMMITGMLRLFNKKIETVSYISGGNNFKIAILLYLLFSAMILFAIIRNQWKFPNLMELLGDSGRLISDFLVQYDLPATIMNMGILGVFSTSYILYLDGELNGPIIGGIFTIVGFGAMGKHIKNVVPIILGVFLASLLSNPNTYNSTGVLLTTLFSTTLAPVAGHYGPIYGILAGVIHLSMAGNIGYLHGGMNLYNNGFSGGFVAAILVPIFDTAHNIFTKTGEK